MAKVIHFCCKGDTNFEAIDIEKVQPQKTVVKLRPSQEDSFK